MLAYTVRRFAQVPVVLIAVTLALFVIMRLLPGDPVQAIIGESEAAAYDDEAIQALREELGLDKPVLVQYQNWLMDLARGDLGLSTRNRLPVREQIFDRIPATLHLGIGALALAVCVGIPAGVLSAVKRNSPIDFAATFVAICGLAIPNFWFSILLIWLFVVEWHWLPAAGFTPVWSDPIQSVKTLTMPTLALGLTLSASLMRHTRASVLDVLNQDYVRTARAKGLGEFVTLRRHVMRNATLPIVTIIGLQVGGLLSGSVIIETMFSIPGIGRLAIQSINSRDYAMLQGVVLFFALITLLVNLITDMAYAVVDPRIKY